MAQVIVIGPGGARTTANTDPDNPGELSEYDRLIAGLIPGREGYKDADKINYTDTYGGHTTGETVSEDYKGDYGGEDASTPTNEKESVVGAGNTGYDDLSKYGNVDDEGYIEPTTDTETETTEEEVSTGFQNTQIWELDGQKFVIFSVPETELYIRYSATDTLLDNYYSSGRVKPEVQTITADNEKWINSNMFGSLAEVDADILTGKKEPFQGLVDKWDVAKEYRPWLKDDELYGIWLEAFIEDRDILDEEWKTTEWWRDHTKEQRDWLLLSQSKDLGSLPQDAQAYLNNNLIKFRDMFKAAGVSNINDIKNAKGESMLDWFSFQFTSGDWTELVAMDQLKAIADPSTGIELEEAVTDWFKGLPQGTNVETTKKFEAQVENLSTEWLGPLYGILTDDQKSNYAGMIRNAETEQVGADMVVDRLKAIRGTLFGEYDESLTYNEIATPWRNYSFQLLGQRMDETDSTFVDVVKANDQRTATQMLTEWGINNNAATLLDKVTDDIGQATGAGQVVRGVPT